MIFNQTGIAFPDYQNKDAAMFLRTEKHDIEQWEFCKKYLKNTRVCIDFGAHVGISALRYSKAFECVISFEPIPDLFECLTYNTRNLNNSIIHQCAIGSKKQEIYIFVNPENTGSNVIESEETKKLVDSRWGNKKRINFQKENKIKVQCNCIDSYNLENVDFVKIDTEGYNMEPLRGMKNTLKRCSPIIQMERASPYKKDASNFLRELGYNLIKTIDIDDIFVREK